jgi:hypothetical protein
VRDDVPATVTVHGVIHGHPFTETLTVTTKRSDDATDLRLRWEWDSLRSNPRFQKILAGPEPKTIY